MSFLSIAFLTALPLAALPILLHLFDRRRNVVIEWGAMQFLMEAAVRRTSARKLKQWLLILLRVLTVLFLILALSRPLMPGRWFASSERGETIIVLDNSLSMDRQAGDQSQFEQALTAADELLAELSEGDTVRVLLASPYPVWATAGSLRIEDGSREELAERLRSIETTGSRSDLLAALFTALQAEYPATLDYRRIVLLTDGQQVDWAVDDKTGWERFRESLKAAPLRTDLEIVELSQETAPAGNLAVREIRSSRVVAGTDQTVTLTAQVVNHGTTASAPQSAVWTIGDRKYLESDLPALEPGASHDLFWQHSFSDTGAFAVTCRIDGEDELPVDNEATTIVEVVESIPILVTESSPELAELQRDAFFFQTALGWVDGQPLDQRSVYVPRLIDPEELAFLDLSEPQAVIIPNLQTLSADAVQQLTEFVYRGGGLWIALGPRTDIDAFNQLLFAEGNGLAPLAVDNIVEQEDADGESGGTRINPFQKEHPATAHLTDSQKLDTGDVTVDRCWRFQKPPAGSDASVLLSLTDGEPLAVEKYFGRGRVIVQSIPLRMQWSDLARSQAFVVMAQEWTAYLTQPRAVPHNLTPGDPILVERPDAGLRTAILNTPQGDQVELTADVRGDRVVFQSSRTALPGRYLLELGTSGDAIPFQVQRDAAESDLTPLSAEERQLFADLTGIRQEQTGDGFHGTTQSQPVWSLLLMLLIAVISAELILSGIISRERFGTEPIIGSTARSGSGADTVAGIPSARAQPPVRNRQPAATVETG